jgi:hypothetical protein
LSQFAAANIDVAVSNTKPRLRRCFTMARIVAMTIDDAKN